VSPSDPIPEATFPNYETLQAQEQWAKEAATREFAEHELTVVREDGVYRHLRCQKPSTYSYGFDIVTWPGHLTICGDIGDYTFARLDDMFQFFREGANHWRINPGYWGEKLQGRVRGRTLGMEYSRHDYVQDVVEWFRDTSEDMTEGDAAALHAAVMENLLDPWDSGWEHDESYAHQLLRDFQHEDIRIGDSWEWSLQRYDTSFLRCCWAIVWAIREYDRATVTS
jgi:hypothetical protein